MNASQRSSHPIDQALADGLKLFGVGMQFPMDTASNSACLVNLIGGFAFGRMIANTLAANGLEFKPTADPLLRTGSLKSANVQCWVRDPNRAAEVVWPEILALMLHPNAAVGYFDFSEHVWRTLAPKKPVLDLHAFMQSDVSVADMKQTLATLRASGQLPLTEFPLRPLDE